MEIGGGGGRGDEGGGEGGEGAPNQAVNTMPTTQLISHVELFPPNPSLFVLSKWFFLISNKRCNRRKSCTWSCFHLFAFFFARKWVKGKGKEYK